jgi:hypothetical protein
MKLFWHSNLVPFIILASSHCTFGFLSASKSTRCCTNLHGSGSPDDNGNEAAWDADVEYEKEWPTEQAPPDPSTAWDAIPNMPVPARLGIGVSLEPLNEEDAASIKREAEEIINARIDEGIQDIERLRKKMAKEMDQSRKMMQMASELEGKRKSDELMKKIDQITEKFLDSTKEVRTSTKMAAAASRAMEGTGKGVEMGTWGTVSGRTVVASDSGSLLGSIDNAAKEQQTRTASDKSTGTTSDGDEIARVENRIIIVADIKEVGLVANNLELRIAESSIPTHRLGSFSGSTS